MKKIQLTVNHVLTALLAALGFTACSEENGGGSDEYGVPIVDYKVKGSVTDTEGNPVEGIRVVLKSEYDRLYTTGDDPQFIGSTDTLHTAADGSFESPEYTAFAIGGKLYFEDVDSTEHGGAFRRDSLDLQDMERTQTQKGNGWYDGKYELTATKQLTRETATEE